MEGHKETFPGPRAGWGMVVGVLFVLLLFFKGEAGETGKLITYFITPFILGVLWDIFDPIEWIKK